MKTTLQTANYAVQDTKEGYRIEGTFTINADKVLVAARISAFNGDSPVPAQAHVGSLTADMANVSTSIPGTSDVAAITTILLDAFAEMKDAVARL